MGSLSYIKRKAALGFTMVAAWSTLREDLERLIFTPAQSERMLEKVVVFVLKIFFSWLQTDRQLALLNSIEAGILLCGNGGFRHGGPSLSLARTVRLSVTRSRLLPPLALYCHFLPYLTIAPIALSVLSL